MIKHSNRIKVKANSAAIPASLAPSVVDADEVLPELLGDGGALLGDHGLLVHADQDGLVGLHDVHTTEKMVKLLHCRSILLQPLPSSLLSSHDSVCTGQEHVLDASDGDPGHGEHVHVAVVGGDLLQLVHGGTESSGRCPDVSIMTTDDRLLDFLE